MKRIPIGLAFLLPTLAFAHPGTDAGLHHGSAFLMGVIHPFTGLDHLFVMIAVGIWSIQAFGQSRRDIWAIPVAFAGLLLVGGVFGLAEAGLPVAETMIAASLLVLGLFVALRVELRLLAGVSIVGTFAIFHGIAHSSELPTDHPLAALSGIVIGTMLLHIAGMLLGRFVLERNVWLPRIAGAVVASSGLGMLAVSF